jgi:transposase
MNPTSEKLKSLAEKGSLNLKPEEVKDELFLYHEFFDPCDLMQVKYEMVRRVQVENWRVSDAAKTFGFSRVAFYQIQKAIEEQGFAGIMPQKRGPKSAYKLTKEVMLFIGEKLSQDDKLKAATLAELIEEEFGFTIHVRSIEKALHHRKKNKRIKSKYSEFRSNHDKRPI